jgi:hypothetical protein
MAAVVKAKPKTEPLPDKTEPNREAVGPAQLTAPLLSSAEERADNVVVDIERPHNRQVNGNPASNAVARSSEDIEDGEVVGIITLEDVFEELLQVRFKNIFILVACPKCYIFNRGYHTTILYDMSQFKFFNSSILQEEIVDETDEYVDVHKRCVSTASLLLF